MTVIVISVENSKAKDLRASQPVYYADPTLSPIRQAIYQLPTEKSVFLSKFLQVKLRVTFVVFQHIAKTGSRPEKGECKSRSVV